MSHRPSPETATLEALASVPLETLVGGFHALARKEGPGVWQRMGDERVQLDVTEEIPLGDAPNARGDDDAVWLRLGAPPLRGQAPDGSSA
jgi:hypothetical protein